MKLETPRAVLGCGWTQAKQLTIGLFVLATLGVESWALTTDNPYSAIANRNAFALKPPVVVTNAPTTPEVAPAGIELQGITTILGKPQVFLKIKQPPRPPKPAEDLSVVLEAGDREGDVQVISIDAAAGLVRLENRGAALALNMQDNAATPTAVPVAAPPVPGLALPRPAGMPAPAGVIPTAKASSGGVSTTTVGGAASGASRAANIPTLPSRNVRAGGTALGGGTAQNQPETPPLSALEQAALMEIERERTRKLVEEGKYPPLPPIPGMQQ
jgi:hypothetical protein